MKKQKDVLSRADKILKEFPFLTMVAIAKHTNAKRSLLPHKNDGIEICFVYEGKYEWEIEGKRVSINKGEASLTCPWQIHGGYENTIGPGKLGWLIIVPKVFTKDKLTVGKWSGFSADEEKILGKMLINRSGRLGKNEKIGSLLSEIHKEINETRVFYKTRVHSLCSEIIIEAARGTIVSEKSSKEIILKALSKMEENISEDWTLEKLSSIAGLGTTAFIDGVKETLGLSPKNYLLRLRIEKAKVLLAEKKESITEIAFSLGFSSSQHFSQIFRKYTGFSPKEYKENI